MLKLGYHLRPLEIAELIAQHRFAQPALRGGGPVRRLGGGTIGRERVLVAGERLGQPPVEHGDDRLEIGRHTERLELVELVRCRAEIARLDRGAHRFREHEALQLDRQRADRRLDSAECLARLGPFALLGVGDRAPELRLVLVADERIGEILERLVGARQHDVGDRAHHQAGRVLLGRSLVAEHDVEHGLGFRIHVAGEIEARQLEARRGTFRLGCRGGDVDELNLAVGKLRLAVEAP